MYSKSPNYYCISMDEHPNLCIEFSYLKKSPVQSRGYENSSLLLFDISGTSLLVLIVFIFVFSVLDKIAEFGSEPQSQKTSEKQVG